jgi:hypothetical protein
VVFRLKWCLETEKRHELQSSPASRDIIIIDRLMIAYYTSILSSFKYCGHVTFNTTPCEPSR